MCLTIYFKHFVFIELFDLNSNPNSLFERSSIKGFLVDFLVYLAILYLKQILYSAKFNIYIKAFFAWISSNN